MYMLNTICNVGFLNETAETPFQEELFNVMDIEYTYYS